MAITTYAELQTELGNWLNRSDLTAQLPEFIELAEARFNREIRTPEMLTRNDSFTVDSQYESVPSDFLEVERFTLLTTPVLPMRPVTSEEMSELRHRITTAGKPCYYAVVGTSFEFLPSPDQAYTASLLYYSAFDGLASTDPNWLLTGHPDIYLFGALVEAQPYVYDDERFPLWEARLEKALASLRRQGDSMAVGGTPIVRARSFG